MTTEYLSLLESLPTATEARKEPVRGTAVVNLDKRIGTPKHLASGWIYGIPDSADQIPDHFYTDIGFRYGRGGGSQLPNTVGWTNGVEDYKARFASALSNYRTTRKYGGEFVYLISAIWGADGTQAPDAPYPGDNGDWSSWNELLKQWITDVKESDMLEGLIFDIWNEPDLKYFWNRPREQWLEMWGRTYHTLKKELPTLRLSGPCLSSLPSPDDEWWTEFLTFITRDGSIPDQWSWHMEQGEGDMPLAISNFKQLLETYKLPNDIPVNINEYATWSEQVPNCAAWWIAQLERENAIGLRGNWAMAGALHDFLAGLVGKPGAGTDGYSVSEGGYWPTAEFQVYRYYAQVMTGERVETQPTADGLGDAYAVVGEDHVFLLAGTRIRTGKWTVEVRGLESVGLTGEGMIAVDVLEFEGAEDHFKHFDAPKHLGQRKVAYRGGKLELEVDHTHIFSAFAFEIRLKA